MATRLILTSRAASRLCAIKNSTPSIRARWISHLWPPDYHLSSAASRHSVTRARKPSTAHRCWETNRPSHNQSIDRSDPLTDRSSDLAKIWSTALQKKTLLNVHLLLHLYPLSASLVASLNQSTKIVLVSGVSENFPSAQLCTSPLIE